LRADLGDWGRLDLAAVVRAAAVAARADGARLWLVGHSFGGHALALLPEPGEVHACYTFGTGAGWHGWMPPRERVRVLALWHLVMPVLTRLRGYAPWSLLGGADLPLGVYRQWKRWCRRPAYCFDDPTDGAAMRVAAARLTLPIAAAASLDDPWSPPRSRDAFLRGYANAAVSRVDLDPVSVSTGAIGHLGYFRATARPLWDAALDWLGVQPALTRAGCAGAPQTSRKCDAG
jgi:predicted alpha/beta hydrolase